MKKAQRNFVMSAFKRGLIIAPAYKNLVRNKGGLKEHPLGELKQIPVTDKKSYILKYGLHKLLGPRKIPAMIYASSGSSGKPTFWFRDEEQEVMGGDIHEIIFRKIFNIKKHERTLVMVCFSMGVWVAGVYTLVSCRLVAKKGYNMSIVTPGIEKEDIFTALKTLAPEFDNLVLVGYPPFLMDVISEGLKRGIAIDNRKVKILTAGDKFTEKWRDDVGSLLKMKDPFSSIIAIYGSAEATILGHETPLTIFLRRKTIKNKELFKDLFGTSLSKEPGLVQYHPNYVFFEEINGELVFTGNTAIPLIRYDIHDIGKVIEYREVEKILQKHYLLTEAKEHGLTEWELPFLVLSGRTDVAVTFYALNIYPENIQAALSGARVAKFVTGNFNAYNKTFNHSKDQRLFIKLELKPGLKPNGKILSLLSEATFTTLLKTNMEYRKLYSAIGDKAMPKIVLVENGTLNSKMTKNRTLTYIKGKKPKMIVV